MPLRAVAGVLMNRRIAAGAPFVALAVVAIVVAGAIAAVIAHRPTQPLVWMVAYLVLVVGVMQIVFGAGQAWLAAQPPNPRMVWSQWGLFNLGNAGVIGGTLCRQVSVVAAGMVLFVLAIGWFLYGVRHCRERAWGIVYRMLLALILISAAIGLALSLSGAA